MTNTFTDSGNCLNYVNGYKFLLPFLNFSELMNLFIKKTTALIFSILFPVLLFANTQTKIDSLENVLLTIQEDTGKVNLINELADIYLSTSPEKAHKYANKALKLAKKLSYKQGLATSLYHIGRIYYYWSEYEKAIEYYQQSLKIYEELANSPDSAEATSGKKGIAISLGNIGVVYTHLSNYKKSIEYYKKSLKIDEELNNIQGIAYSLNNIGTVYSIQKNYEEALEYYQRSIEIYRDLDNKQGIAMTLNNIGDVFEKWGKYEKALEYFLETLNLCEELDHKYGIALSMDNIGSVYKNWGNHKKAIEYYNKSLELAKSMNLKDRIMENYESFCDVYSAMGSYQKALEYHKKYADLKDSVFTEESTKQIAEMQEKYESEKKEQKIKLLNKDKIIQQTKIQQQNIIIYSFVLGFFIIIVFSFLLYRQYAQKKKANQILEKQKQEITDSIQYASRIQTAILPPDEYINKSLPQHFILNKPRDIVSGDFYWVTKKDNKTFIAAADCTGHGVPGAFMSMLGVSFLNEIVTKHTPAHAQSNPPPLIEGNNEKSPLKKGGALAGGLQGDVLQANEILNQLCENVMISLHQTGKEGEAKDGMDIALCILEYTSNNTALLQYSGANNPLYIVKSDVNIRINANDTNKEVGSHQSAVGNKNKSSTVILNEVKNLSTNKSPEQIDSSLSFGMTGDGKEKNGYELIEIKGDKMPIGIHAIDRIADLPSFTNHEIQLTKNDTFYIFSDGFADQFGGEKGKKFKYKPFKQLLLDIQDKTMKEQEAILAQTFEEWKGKLSQVDDILVMGIRI